MEGNSCFPACPLRCFARFTAHCVGPIWLVERLCANTRVLWAPITSRVKRSFCKLIFNDRSMRLCKCLWSVLSLRSLHGFVWRTGSGVRLYPAHLCPGLLYLRPRVPLGFTVFCFNSGCPCPPHQYLQRSVCCHLSLVAVWMKKKKKISLKGRTACTCGCEGVPECPLRQSHMMCAVSVGPCVCMVCYKWLKLACPCVEWPKCPCINCACVCLGRYRWGTCSSCICREEHEPPWDSPEHQHRRYQHQGAKPTLLQVAGRWSVRGNHLVIQNQRRLSLKTGKKNMGTVWFLSVTFLVTRPSCDCSSEEDEVLTVFSRISDVVLLCLGCYTI